MRHLSASRLPRLGPALMTGLLVTSSLALAASPARAESAPVAYVLSFNNSTRVTQPDLGRMAAQRIAANLEKAGARTVVPEGRIQEVIQELEVTAPFNQATRLQLATKLEAQQVVHGSVTSARFTPAPHVRAKVRLMVVIETPSAAQPQIQALSVEGSSKLRTEHTDDAALLEEAMDNAAGQLATTLRPAGSIAGVPVRVASAVPTVAAPVLTVPTSVVGIPVVTQPPAPEGANGALIDITEAPKVVVDAAGIDRDMGAVRRRRGLITTRTARNAVGGVLLLAILGLATGGPLGALGPIGGLF